MDAIKTVLGWLIHRDRLIRPDDHYREPLPPYGMASFVYLKNLFLTLPADSGDPETRQQLKSLIEETEEKRPPSWGDLFILDLGILRLQSDEELALRAPGLRDRLRKTVDDVEFSTILKTPGSGSGSGSGSAEPAPALRAELEFIVREIYNRYAMTAAREANRNFILGDIILFSILYIFAITILIFFCFFALRTVSHRSSANYGDLLITAYIASLMGCIGGYVSIKSRIQSLPYEGDPLFRMIAVNKGWLSVYLAPVSGSIFAIIAYLLFAAQLVKGDLLPEFRQYPHDEVPGLLQNLPKISLNDVYDFPKLFVWSFIIGFAERYVPDTLNRLVDKGRSRVIASISPAPAADGKAPPKAE